MIEEIKLKRPGIDDIAAARERIAPYIHHTPVMTSENIDEITGVSIFFKCENLQKIGAFKMRGATNAILNADPEQLKSGVATHSSGNHAQAVALAAKLTGTRAYIVMPENSPSVKRSAVAGYGAEIILCEPTLAAREASLNKVVEETGALFVPPYDSYEVITGQATAAAELIDEVPDLDAIITPVGGGGLLSGTALAAHYLAPHIKVYAGEPKNADDAYQSFKSGSLQPVEAPQTIADGLKTSLGVRNFDIIRELVSDIFPVSEEEIVAAMKLIWERMKIVVEPSSAVALAAIITNPDVFRNKRVGLIITGGNVDLGHLPFK